MGTATLCAGAVVRIDGVEHRLLRKVSETLWQLENPKNGRIVNFEHRELLHMIVEKRLVLKGSDTVSQAITGPSTISEQDLHVAKMRRTYVEAILKTSSSKNDVMTAVMQVWQRIKMPECPPSYISVYRWRKMYLGAGRDFRVLVNRDFKKGNRTPFYPAEIVSICEEAIKSKYLRREKHTVKGVLDKALYDLSQANKLRVGTDQLQPKPSARFITRLIQGISEFDKYSAHHGHTAAVHRYRSSTGQRSTQGPLERAEIDHTLLDLFVLDDKRYVPLGRPTLTICIDDYSRCILGIYISFNTTSYYAVAQCLKHCLLPKVDLKEQVPNIVNEWHAHGVMRALVCDNGLEFHGTSLEQACLALGIEIHVAPRRQPWFKGKVERVIGTLTRATVHNASGTTFSNIFDKGDYNPERHAVVTISQLKATILKWVADVYHQEVHSALQTTPAAMWTASIAEEDIPLVDDTIDLDAVLGRVEKRVLTHKGIEYLGLFYNSRELGDLSKREGMSLSVEIRVDDSDIGQIWVICPKTSNLYKVPAIRLSYANGTSRYQHEVYRNYQAKHIDITSGQDGLLEAKEAISRMLEGHFSGKNPKAGKKYARFNEGSGKQSSKPRARGAKVEQPVMVDGPPKSAIHPHTAELLDFATPGRDRSQALSNDPQPYFKPTIKPSRTNE